jgi:deferrochelatase/peroxidase EfeB
MAGAAARLESASSSDGAAATRAYDGRRQAGIATPRQAHMTLAAFDLVTPDPGDVTRLLEDWTELTVALCGGAVAADALAGLGPSGLTVTVGLGPGLFEDRYGLSDRRPSGLPRGGLPGDEPLDARLGDGDLLVQVCAEDRQVVFGAVHQLASAALGIARRRWTQHGFLSRPRAGATPRGVIGFQDGTANLSTTDAAGLARHVWVAPGDDRDGMLDGTYLVYRRIRIRLQAWDRSAVAEQERVVGRRKASGARLGSAAPRSHARAMHPDANDGVRLLRRSYSYDDGATAGGDADAGLAFIAFARDPQGCGRLLGRFERDDDLRRYAISTAGAVFAIPPAPGRGEHVGERLLT